MYGSSGNPNISPMAEYRPTIGLEIHAELHTRTKMFCACKNDPDEERPNVNICPVCMAHPGTLPVINREAVHKVLQVGAALKGKLADYTYFDRKNYFYPDISKGYQISQYKDPLVSGGELAGVAITRVHLEEDTARSQHRGEKSLVDFNRAGVPLMELVTEPVIHDPQTAGRFARELQLLLRYLGASAANMEKGEMRVEANISVSATDKFGTKVEVKNLNSFRSVERAIEYEVQRQIKALEKGEEIIQETRGWDEGKQHTFSQRKKESSHDYRYFPEPDLPALKISELPEFALEKLQQELPELPEKRRERYLSLGLKKDDADMFVMMSLFGNFFDEILRIDTSIVMLAANYLGSDIAGALDKKQLDEKWLNHENAKRFTKLMILVKENKLSSRGAKDTLALMFSDARSPEEIATEKGLIQQSDAGALEEMAKKVIAANEKAVAEYKAGKAASLQFLVGQGMKESRGSANPALLREIFERLLA